MTIRETHDNTLTQSVSTSWDVPDAWAGQRVLLHFGGVDWETTVWVNGHEATHHRGG